MFCTTNPEKVLQTVKSRIQLTIDVRKQSIQDMAKRLMQISEMEHLTVSQEALEIIARKGDRVPRECINLLENIAKTYDGQVTIDNVKKELGSVTSEIYMEYFRAANRSLSDILLFVKKLKDNDTKLNEFTSGLMGFALDSMYIKHGISLEEYPADYIKQVKELFEMYNSSDFDMLLQILENLSKNLTAEDDSKNEVLLVTTAMRISKINLLANGLANEQKESIAENKLSLFEHSKKLKANNETISEKLKMDLGLDNIKESFEDVTTITDTAGLLDSIELPELKPMEKVEDTKSNKESIGSDVDNFFDD
jgi:DNA polymerase-3 subunit gamma/tau